MERGYNRDHEDLAQFNLGMFCDEDIRMPLYYDRYNGSLTDRSSLTRRCDAFTLGMPVYLIDAEQAVGHCRNRIERYANELPDYHIYCMGILSTLYDVSGKIMVYYDPWNHVNL